MAADAVSYLGEGRRPAQKLTVPQCNHKTIVILPEDFDPAITGGVEPRPSPAAVELLADLTGTVQRTPVSLLYRAGLALVPMMMILLPVGGVDSRGAQRSVASTGAKTVSRCSFTL